MDSRLRTPPEYMDFCLIIIAQRRKSRWVCVYIRIKELGVIELKGTNAWWGRSQLGWNPPLGRTHVARMRRCVLVSVKKSSVRMEREQQIRGICGMRLSLSTWLYYGFQYHKTEHELKERRFGTPIWFSSLMIDN